MGRMLDALKSLEARLPTDAPPEAPLPGPASLEPSASVPTPLNPAPLNTATLNPAPVEPQVSDPDWDQLLDSTAALVDDAVEAFGLSTIEDEDLFAVSPPPLPVEPPPRPAPIRRATPHAPPFESCTLPVVGEPADYYLEAAARICDQGSTNYSNVLLFVSADRGSDACFSMTELAQAFACQSPGDLLLIDGDLREGRLSKQISRPGAGMVEAMLGQVQWPDLIHPTNIARIDFVARGSGHVPTFERPQFGWSALRPLYRTILIGPANQAEPETLWMAARCDAVYFVLSRLHTRRSHATAAVNALRAGGANIAGCIVVND